MTNELLMWLLGAQSIVIIGLAGWIFAHERGCSLRWSDHMREFGTLKGKVEQWHEDHKRDER